MSIFRPLCNNRLAESFVRGVLEIKKPNDVSEAVSRIVAAETGLDAVRGKETNISIEYRDCSYINDDDREGLSNQILYELLSFARLPDDDKISLGKGGALPCVGKGQCKSITKCRGIKPCKKAEQLPLDRQAFIITGLPASGKSSIASKIAEHYEAVILDSDYAKRKLPEYEGQNFGAHLVHEEADQIIFGNKETSLFGYCVYKGYNLVIPKIGYSVENVLKIKEALIKAKYKVHLVLVSLDRKLAVQRAYKRYKDTKRYVPLSLIFDAYANDPILTYYRLKKKKQGFSSFAAISTEKSSPQLIDASSKTPITNIYKN